MNVGVLATSRRRSSPSFLAPHVTDGRGCLVSGLRVNSGIRKVMVVRVCVAGGAGAIGRRLVPQLVARGHQVTATTTSPGKLGLLERLGADGAVMDGLDAGSGGEAGGAAPPGAIVPPMNPPFAAPSGKPGFEHPHPLFPRTHPLRPEGA